jgi:DNA-binding transcriptional ArsR family regulator
VETNAAVRILAALANETRLELFRKLVQAGHEGMSPGALARQLDVPNATLSFHLKELSQAGLASARQHGRFQIYTTNYATMAELLTYLTENCCGGVPCIDRSPADELCCPPMETPD